MSAWLPTSLVVVFFFFGFFFICPECPMWAQFSLWANPTSPSMWISSPVHSLCSSPPVLGGPDGRCCVLLTFILSDHHVETIQYMFKEWTHDNLEGGFPQPLLSDFILFYSKHRILFTLGSLSRMVIICHPWCQVESVKNFSLLLLWWWRGEGYLFSFLPNETI